MTTRIPASLLIAATLAVAAPGPAAAAIDRYEGVARDRAGGAIAYRETHWRLAGGDLSRVVLYRCPDGTPFARKRLWGDPDDPAPRFDFLDGRDGYREGVRAAAGGLEVYWRERADDPERSAAVVRTAASVFDAGFDALVRTALPRLRAGRAVTAEFLVPSRQAPLGVRIAPEPGGDPGTLRLKMALDAWYGFVAPRTRLTYSIDGWLLRFEGVGTIRDDRGRHRDVRIDFPPDRRVAGVARDDVDAALAAPLARACTG